MNWNSNVLKTIKVPSARSRMSAVGLALCTLAFSLTAAAESGSPLRWHGFFNQGYTLSDHNNFYGESSEGGGSFEFTDIGAGLSYRPNSWLQASAQAIYRRAGKTSPDGVQLDYGLIDITAINRDDFGLGFRVGRIKNPYGLYNETRDITASRPSILLPESIYVDTLREISHTSDGVSLYSYKEYKNFLVSLDANLGEIIIDRPAQKTILGTSLPGDLVDNRVWLTRLQLEDSNQTWKLAWTHVQFDADYQPDTVDFAVEGEVSTTMNIFSAEYNWRRWQLTSEHMHRDFDYFGIVAPNFYQGVTSDSLYLQASYRINRHWQALLRYDRLYMDRDDKSDRNFTPNHDGYAKDWTLGVRYQWSRQWLISAELHRVQGTAWISSQENPDPLDTEERWHLFTAQISWRF